MLRVARKRFGELAVTKGLITEKQLEQALREQEEARIRGMVHKKIGAILLDKGYIDEEDIKAILKEQERSSPWSAIAGFLGLKGRSI